MALTPRRMIEVSLQRMLAGAVAKLGGSEKVGDMLAEIIADPETDRKDRLMGLTTIVKLTGQFAAPEEDTDATIEQQIEMLKKLDAEYAAGYDETDGEPGGRTDA